MANYLEIANALKTSGTLHSRVMVALIIAADGIRAKGAATTAEQKWATAVIANPNGYAPQALALVLAQNRNLSIAQIEGGADSALQNAVDNAVPMLVAGRE